MTARDPHRFINELDNTAIERLITRLESRAKDAVFAQLLDKYIAKLELPTANMVLEVGCGTGAVSRHLAQHSEFIGKAIGVDQCRPFIDTANKLALDEAINEQVEFRLGDAHNLNFPPATFDVVIAHTLISHVTEPEVVLREMANVVRPGGSIVIFDGDYASLTYSHPDHAFGYRMDTALAVATFNNPRVMRELPRVLPELGLKVKEAWGDAVVEIGSGSFFKSFAEAYVPYVIRSGMIAESEVNDWLELQKQSMDEDTFFASCNYYTYMVCRD
ncbi:MAG: methyltransferase domain-containing protein [Gammaproteobacteria bacterium]|nr:methyltransferase domain-containing protein [Gammaproteobacteria bacterium]